MLGNVATASMARESQAVRLIPLRPELASLVVDGNLRLSQRVPLIVHHQHLRLLAGRNRPPEFILLAVNPNVASGVVQEGGHAVPACRHRARGPLALPGAQNAHCRLNVAVPVAALPIRVDAHIVHHGDSAATLTLRPCPIPGTEVGDIDVHSRITQQGSLPGCPRIEDGATCGVPPSRPRAPHYIVVLGPSLRTPGCL